LRLLQYATVNEPLGEVATLGRQCVHLDGVAQSKLLSPSPPKPYGPYCEELLLERFGAKSVTSFDVSDYEHATVVHDMNTPLRYHRQFDTVIDFGTLEHVFNSPVALANVAALCKSGGRIMHSLPANNYSGHGFYQFSPELFFSLYSAKNGFAGTEIFIAEVNDGEYWWKSAVPSDGVRVEYSSDQRSYVLVLSRKIEEDTRQSVQQSDYVVNWKDGEVKPPPRRPSLRESTYKFLKTSPVLWRFADTIAKPVDTHANAEYHRLSKSNPGYQRVKINDLVRRS
jgi:SAM-dependent methyltransferase